LCLSRRASRVNNCEATLKNSRGVVRDGQRAQVEGREIEQLRVEIGNWEQRRDRTVEIDEARSIGREHG
jgi:hypothetical protein